MKTDKPMPTGTRGQLVRELYFPTPIYFMDLPDSEKLNDTLKPHIYAWQSRDPKGIVRSNVEQVGSWHSQLDMHLREEYRLLTTHVLAAAQQIYDNLGYDPASEAAFDNMWAIINPRYGYNRRHVHPNTFWSGVYYVQAPPDCGRIFFTDPRPQALMVVPHYDAGLPRKSEVWSEVYFEPVEGRLILFPSWLVHEVEPNLSTGEGQAGDRISVSFNFFQKPKQGS